MCDLITEIYSCGHKSSEEPTSKICKSNCTVNVTFCPAGAKDKEKRLRWPCGDCALEHLKGIFKKKKPAK
jgi:hypothetical protein